MHTTLIDAHTHTRQVNIEREAKITNNNSVQDALKVEAEMGAVEHNKNNSHLKQVFKYSPVSDVTKLQQ